MRTPTTITRTIRLAIGTAAVLALMSQSAQARPSGVNQRTGLPKVASVQTTQLVRKGTYMPIPASLASQTPRARADASPMGLTHLQLMRGPLQPTKTVNASGFNWYSAAIAVGSVLAVMLIGAAALTTRGRRQTPLST